MVRPRRHPIPLAGLVAAVALLLAPAPASATTVLHVSPDGSDAGAGTLAEPFRTVERALKSATGGETIQLAAGEYPFFRDIDPNLSWITITGPTSGAPASIAGGEIAGASWLRFEHVRFTRRLTLRGHPKFGQDRPAHHIAVVDSELTNDVPLTDLCLTLRQGAHDVTIARNDLHHCTNGITGPGDGITDPALRRRPMDIVVRDNVIRRMRGDGIQFGHWTDVTIARNHIAHMADPDRKEHNDGIQITGDSARVAIEGNVITDSTQLLFVQDAFGPNQDVRISGNLLTDSRAYGLQVQATENLVLTGNTMWRTTYGGILLRKGGFTGFLNPGAIVVNNISDAFVTSGGIVLAHRDHNLFKRSTSLQAPNELIGVDPRFADPDAGDFRLGLGSPAIGAGDPLYGGPDMGAGLTLRSLLPSVTASAARAAGRRARKAKRRTLALR